MDEQWFGPAEMAKRLGVSAKALRVYEREGLVIPLRTQAGWRAYGPEQALRLHQVLTLKCLGLPLKQIAALLAGRLASLDAVLELQQSVLQRRRDEADRALALLSAAREKLARDGVLSPEDLTQLTRETVMTDQPKYDDEWRKAFEALAGKYYTPEQMEAVRREKKAAYAKAGYDQQSFMQEWEALFEELRAVKALGDVTSPRACEMVRRWNALTSPMQRDPDLARTTRAIWADAVADPEVARQLPVQPDDLAFVQRIADGMRERGELPPRA
ncbi:MAG: MerR family transcriptional regulator [Caulobacter sp.]|nr:MerR family transcriptional regulator [Caulobacter sp.]